MKKETFIFRKLNDIDKFESTGKTFDLDRSMEKVAEVWGSLITLFGQTEYFSDEMEEAFSYLLEAIDDEGQSIYFEIYFGATGLAIGVGAESHTTDKAKEMADFFMDKLASTIPSEFDYVGYYSDYGCKVELGVAKGRGYAIEIEL